MPNDEDIKRIILKALELPPNRWKWDEIFDELEQAGDVDAQRASDSLSRMGVECGLLSTYLGYRGAFGCGDSGHEAAIAKASKKQRHYRKAHGYSYP